MKNAVTGAGAVGATPQGIDLTGWQFRVDRFGVRFDDESLKNESLKIEYARKAVRALILWTETIELLFGDLSETMIVATNAYLLPQYPYWASISEAIEILQKWLGPDHARNLEEGGDPPGAGSSTQLVTGQIVNPRTQDYVYQLQLYLEAMQKWAPAFSAATWVASLAGTGSAAADPQIRLLQGLKTVAAVYEFDSTTEPTAILERFAGVLGSDADESPMPAALRDSLEVGRKLIQHSAPSPEFAKDPAQFYQWLKDWAATATSHPHRTNEGVRGQWGAIEDSYWSQWSWPSVGAVSRHSGAAPAVSPLDLIYTARYGAVPLLHWRGGTLSICQWSRIMAIATQRRVRALNDPATAGLGNLGFEPTSPPGPVPNSMRLLPIAMISPQSERSPAWTWRPDPSVRAFAILPRALAESDEQAASEDPGTEKGSRTGEQEIKNAVEEAGRDPYSTFLHFIEVMGGQSPEVLNEKIPWAYWRRVGFGFDGTQRAIPPSVSNPRSVSELVELTKAAYPELFPRSVEAETAIARFLFRLGRVVRLVQVQISRQRASIVRVLRMLKRTYVSFFRSGE